MDTNHLFLVGIAFGLPMFGFGFWLGWRMAISKYVLLSRISSHRLPPPPRLPSFAQETHRPKASLPPPEEREEDDTPDSTRTLN